MATQYNIGDRVLHPQNGSGVVIDVEGDTLAVLFDTENAMPGTTTRRHVFASEVQDITVRYERVSAWQRSGSSYLEPGEYDTVYKFSDGTEYFGELYGVRDNG